MRGNSSSPMMTAWDSAVGHPAMALLASMNDSVELQLVEKKSTSAHPSASELHTELPRACTQLLVRGPRVPSPLGLKPLERR